MDRATVRESLESALLQMDRTLGLLDACGAPAEIGAYLDMAMCRLKDHLQAAESDADQLSSGQHSSK